MQTVKKPLWLENLLNSLSWQVFTWRIEVGDPIERAIDWLLSWLNYALYQSNDAFNTAGEALSKALEINKELQASLADFRQELSDHLSSWFLDLSKWKESFSSEVGSWLEEQKDYLLSIIEDTKQATTSLAIQWDNFKSTTLPQLVDTDKLTAWGNSLKLDLSSWLNSRLSAEREETEAQLDPIRQNVDKHDNWLDAVKEFFDDPEDYLIKTLEKALERLW